MQLYFLSLSLILSLNALGMQRRPVVSTTQLCEPLRQFLKQAPDEQLKKQEYQHFIDTLYNNNLTVFDCTCHIFEQKKSKKIDKIKEFAKQYDNADDLGQYLAEAKDISRRIIIDQVNCPSDIPSDICQAIKEQVEIFNQRKKQNMQATDEPINKSLQVHKQEPCSFTDWRCKMRNWLLADYLSPCGAMVDPKKCREEISSYTAQGKKYPLKEKTELHLILHNMFVSGKRDAYRSAILGHEFEHFVQGDSLKGVALGVYFKSANNRTIEELTQQISRVDEKAADGINGAYSLNNAEQMKIYMRSLIEGDEKVDSLKDTHPSNIYRYHQATVLYDLKKQEQHCLEKKQAALKSEQKRSEHFDEWLFHTV